MRFTQAIKTVIDSNPNFGTRLQQAEKLAEKWQKLGLLQGLQGRNDALTRTNVAIMLQNQAKQILRQANYTSTTQFHEQWVGIAMPLVRRFVHKLVAKDFVTIQAMSQPTGLVFFIDHQFGSTRKGFTKGESIYGTSFKNNTGDYNYTMDTDVTKGLYGAGRWGYSLNELTASTNTVTAVSKSGITTADYQNDSRFSTTYANQLASGSIKKLSFAYPADADLNGYDSFYINSATTNVSGSVITKVFREYTRLNGSNIEFMVVTDDKAAWTANSGVTLSYHRQPTTYDRGDFEYQDQDLAIPEVQFKLTQKPIVPETRKMKATWTQELIEDLNAMLAIDGQQEISNQLTDQIVLETDLELIAMIGKGAITSGNNGYFSIRPGFELTNNPDAAGGVATFAQSTSYHVQGRAEWFKNIAVPMQKVSNQIHQKTGKGGANFAVVSPTLATVLQTMQGFTMDTDGESEWMDGGLTKIGSYKSKYKIYKNPYSVADNAMIMGYRGTGFLDFGAAYCPYIPLIMLPNIMEPTNLTPTKGVYTRYAKTMLRSDYYGCVYVEGLETL